MATSTDISCGICERKDITKHADYWSHNSEEGLCSECFKNHEKANDSTNHQIISVDNLKKLPKSISAISHYCHKHDKLDSKHYCNQHESLCCSLCIATDHKNCNDLSDIDDVIKAAKSSSMLESMEESLQLLKQNLHFLLLIDESAQHLLKNKMHQELIFENIINGREMNARFNKLEQQMLNEVSIAEKHIQNRIYNSSKELKEKLRAVDELEQDVIVVKEYASDLQACIGSKSLKIKVEEEEKYMHSLIEKEALKQILLECKLDENLLANILSVTRSELVSTDEINTEIGLHTQTNKQAQRITRPIPSVQWSIHQLHFTFRCKFELPARGTSYDITGCTIRPDGKFILINRNSGTLLLIKENGEIEREINLSNYYPTDVTSVDDKTICVSYCYDNRLELFNTDSFESIQVISINGNSCGITSENGTLYWYEQYKGIQMKHQSNDDITTIVKDNDGGYWSYVSVKGDRIYQTNNKKKTVSCFNLDGEKIWEFKDESMIHDPYGIAIDNASNVYVADLCKGVFVVSSNGKNCRQIIGDDDGVNNCYALFFDRSQDMLLLSNYKGPVFLYNQIRRHRGACNVS